MNLLKNAELTQVINAVAAGTSDTTSGTILDMSGYDSVMFILSLGDVTNTAVVTLQAHQTTANMPLDRLVCGPFARSDPILFVFVRRDHSV